MLSLINRDNKMKLDWIQLEYWESINHPEAWLKLVSGGVLSLVTLLSVMVATYLTYKYAVKHSKNNHNTQIEIDHLHRNIEALEKVWALLAYMSFKESDKGIVKCRKECVREGKKTQHYFYHFNNLERFLLKEIQEVFYTQHAGLFLPKPISQQVFTYRSLLEKLYFTHEKNEEDPDGTLFKIENPDLVKKLREAFERLKEDIKSELELCYQQLLITNK